MERLIRRPSRREVSGITTGLGILGISILMSACVVDLAERQRAYQFALPTPNPSERAMQDEEDRRNGGWFVVNNLLNP